MEIIILASIDKAAQLNLCQMAMSELFREYDIKVLAPRNLFENVEKYENFQYIDENTILDKSKFIEKYKLMFNSEQRATWYYQQFLKYSYGYFDHSIDQYYVVWDCDTIPLQKIEFIDDKKNCIYNRKIEYHMPYFDCIKRLFPKINCDNKNKYGHSFISEYMIFNVDILKEMLNRISATGWIDKILQSINQDDVFKSGFSEFETYGTYISNFYNDTFISIKLNTNRYGSKLFNGKIPSFQKLKQLNNIYVTISFENWK